MPTRKMKPFHLYGEISRIDDEQQIVEGYAYVNETVPGEKGIRLKRAAMEAATADYVANGTSREMHQPIAAGKPLDVTWDDKGAYLRVHVVDDQAWKKVKTGVYRGFSIGVNPKVMRGKDVESCEWWDASLIDRGKDRDALFTVWRGTDPTAEVDVEVIERASFAEYLEGVGPSDLRNMALDYLWNALWDIQNGFSSMGEEMTPEDKESAVRETCGQFTEFMVGAIATGALPNIVDADAVSEERSAEVPEITRAVIEAEAPALGLAIVELDELERFKAAETGLAATIERANTLETTVSTLTTERDEANTELTRARESIQTATARVTELENTPTRERPSTGQFVPVERTFGSPTPNPDADAIKALRDLKRAIESKKPADTKEGESQARQLITISRQLNELGG